MTASPASATTILLEGSGDTLETNNLPNTTLWIQGNDYINQNATLNIPNGLTNHGTILMESATYNYFETLALTGTFINADDGVIQVTTGSGGARTISGAVINVGTINFDTSATLGAAGAKLLNTGLVSIAGATVTVVGNSFTNDPGGLVSGYGTFTTSGVALANNGIIDLSAPSILAVDLEIATVAITYYDTGTMNQATVTNSANYTILGSGGDGIFGNANDVNESSLISQVTYNASFKTVTLQLSSGLPADFYRVEINGTAVVDSSNTPLLAGKLDVLNRALGVVPAMVTTTLDPSSDSGDSNHDGITDVTTPTFDVQVNQAGTIEMDFQGDGTLTAVLSAPVAGVYQFTAPTLADGTYTAVATFDTTTGKSAQGLATYTIDTVGPHVAAMSPTGSVNTSISQVTLTFSEPIDLNTLIPSAITLTGPSGIVAVNQPQLVSSETYSISFPKQAASGAYSLSIAPTVSDLAGNEMDQNQNGINGESDDSFTASFTIALPDLAITASQAPSTGLLGASIPVSWTVTNKSATNPAPSTWTDAVYISPDSVFDGSAVQLLSVAAPDQSPLAPGASYSRNQSVTIPAKLAIGNDFLIFVADNNNGQPESNSANDQVAVPITLVAPDLRVTGLSVQPANPVSGSTIVVVWNDKNTGEGATDSNWVDSVSIVNTSTNQTMASATVPYDASTLGALQPGDFAAQQYAFTLPDGDPGVGNISITVTTDAGHNVIEGNSAGNAESNNTATTSTATTLANYPNLSVSQVSITPSDPQSGDQVTVSWSDVNTGLGNVNQSFDDLVQIVNKSTGQTVASASVPYDVVALGSLAAGTTSAPRQSTLRLPDGLPGVGDLQISVTTDSGNQVFEYDNATVPGGHAVAESNNTTAISATSTLAPYPDLQVAGVSGPASGFNSQAVLVSWTDQNEGTNLATGPWVDDVYAATDRARTQSDTSRQFRVRRDPGSRRLRATDTAGQLAVESRQLLVNGDHERQPVSPGRCDLWQ